MKSKIKILVSLVAILAIVCAYLVGSSGKEIGSTFGSADVTHRYPVASGTVITLVAGTDYRALASSTNTNVYSPGRMTRDYLRFQISGVAGGTVLCNLNDIAASATAWRFVLSSTTPTFSMESGVYQGAVHCISTTATTFSVTEYNY